MDDRDNQRMRGSGAASRPPESDITEDTPLFTDIPYTPTRRAGNSGRPAAPRTQSTGRAFASPYGGRSSSSQQTGRQSAPRGGQSGRTSPVYTELSWDDLLRGTDPDRLGQPQRTPGQGAFPSAAAPQPRSGSQYFGGFDQEMEELFYGRSRNADVQSDASAREEQTARGGYSYGGRTPAPSRDYARPGEARASAPAYRPQSTRRTASQQSSTPAPAQRSAVSRVRPQWTGVFGTTTPAQTKPSRQPARPSTPVRANGGTPPTGGGRSGGGTRTRQRRIPPVLLGGGLVLAALLIFLIARSVGDSSASTRPASVPAAASTSAPAASREPKATPIPEADQTPTPSPEPTPTPAGPKAKKSGDLIVPANWGPVIPERKRAVYDSYFDKSCMIGNSLVEGFFMWSGMTNLRYMYHTGATVNDAIGKLDLAPLTLNAPGYYDNIYLMFGLNEIGTDVNSFVQGYKKLVDYIRQYQPTSNIVIISVTPIMKQVDEDPNEVQSMDRIRTFNAALQEFCADQNCWYLDIYHMLLGKDGYLSKDYAYIGDGKHFEKSGYVAWANYMKTHYVDEKLLTE